MEYNSIAERENCINKVIDEIVDTPKGLKFKKHFDTRGGHVDGWYVTY